MTTGDSDARAARGRVLSVNVGRPRTIEWRGQEVRTAIWKAAVAGRRRARRLNVDGDGQADLVGHGGEHRAVLVYQDASYRHWERELGRTLADAGHFGENLTVAGVPDDEVCIGDRLAIGSALFEVSQPRVTCFKVGIRLDEPRMPALLTGHGRPGFYLRVLEEGEIGAGDVIELVGDEGHGLTVRRVSDLLYRPDFDEAALRTIVASPALSEGWRASFRLQLEQGGRAGNRGLSPLASGPPAYEGWRTFRVRDAVDETASVRSLLLEPLDGGEVPPHRAGQFVTVRLDDPAGGAPVVRSYSLSAAPDGRRLRISVKRDGVASAIVHEGVAVGDLLELGAPRGAFVLDPQATSPVLLISAGIGVTPVLAMLAELSERSASRAVTWVHVARSGAEHALAQEARRLLERLPDAQVHIRYTHPGPADRLGADFDAVGRLTAGDLAALGAGPGGEAYVCGPAEFMRAVAGFLSSLGVEAGRLHTEAFGAAVAAGVPPHAPDHPSAVGPEVTFARSGVAARFDPRRWHSLLELAEACDVPASWSCRTGVCHRCESGLIAGSVSYDPEPLDAPPPGVTLLCCTQPRGHVVLDL